MSEKSRTRIVVISLFIMLPLVFIAGLLLGSESISLQDIKEDKFVRIILFDIRLPRTLLALLCGSLLAGSGAVFQGFFRSPLADSSMLGVTAGAAFGATIGSGLGVWMPFGAFVGAILCIVLVFFLSCGKKSSHEPIRLLLAGNAVSVFLSALTSAIMLIRDKEMYKMYMWTLGSFNSKGFDELKFLIIPSIISFVLFLFCIKPLDLLSSGSLTSEGLGLNTKKVQILCFVAGSIAAAAAVCAGGVIGFVGLICPHIIRILCGSSYKKIIPISLLAGAVFLGIVDIFCRTVAAPTDIPAGIVTSLIGAPFFVFVLLSGRKRKHSL